MICNRFRMRNLLCDRTHTNNNLLERQRYASNSHAPETDHAGMDNLLNAALDGYKNGALSRDSVRSALAHVIAAIDWGNYEEARQWFTNPGLLDVNEKNTHPWFIRPRQRPFFYPLFNSPRTWTFRCFCPRLIAAFVML